MHYYYIHAAARDDEVMNWNGEKFIEYSTDVEGIKQYDALEQALEACDKAIEAARKVGMQVVMIDKAEALIDKPGFKFETIMWERVE